MTTTEAERVAAFAADLRHLASMVEEHPDLYDLLWNMGGVRVTAPVLGLRPHVSPTTRLLIRSQVGLCAAYEPGTKEYADSLDAAMVQVVEALRADAGHCLIDASLALDFFTEAVHYQAEVGLLDTDPDGFLASARLPQTTGERLRTAADLESAQTAALDRLYGLVAR